MSRTTDTKKRNLAARMGRWSANHWKTATFGWLALVVVAFGIGGMVGTKNPNPNTSGPGESGRMDRILDAGFKPRAAESLFIQSATVRAGTPAFDAVVQDAAARISKVPVVRQIEPPKVSKDGHAVLVDFRIAGPKDKALGQGPAGRRRRRGGAGSPSGLLRRRDGRRQRPEGRRGHVRQGSGQGRDAFAPDHAPDPARHVRGARRSGDPAAVRAHRRVRHVRAHRDPEPRPPDAERGPGARAPDRARGRRRLHDVLPPPRA